MLIFGQGLQFFSRVTWTDEVRPIYTAYNLYPPFGWRLNGNGGGGV